MNFMSVTTEARFDAGLLCQRLKQYCGVAATIIGIDDDQTQRIERISSGPDAQIGVTSFGRAGRLAEPQLTLDSVRIMHAWWLAR
jgi:hypothetical protein